MPNRVLFLLCAPLPLVGVVVLVVVLTVVAGDPRNILPASLNAVGSWSSFVGALASVLLVYYAGVTAFLALSEFRLKNRPFLAMRRADFASGGLLVELGNASGGTAVGGEVKVWIRQVGAEHPTPTQWADAVEALAEEIQRGSKPHFQGFITTFDPWERRAETLTWGPRASEYDVAWAGTYGVALWETRATDLLGDKHLLRSEGTGSGAVVVGAH